MTSSTTKPDVFVRPMEPDDFPAIRAMGKLTYPQDEPWDASRLYRHLEVFREGQLVAVDAINQQVVGYAASLIIDWDDYDFQHNWNEFTDHGWFTNHDPEHGRTLYGADVMVHPHVRGRGIGKIIYKARFDLCRRLNLSRIRAGARLIGYHRYADRLTPEEYAMKVINREIGDDTLSFQIKRGFRVIAVVHNYLSSDARSLGYAAVIEWINHAVARPSEYRRRDPRFGKKRRKPRP